jgi:hypothetical protein
MGGGGGAKPPLLSTFAGPGLALKWEPLQWGGVIWHWSLRLSDEAVINDWSCFRMVMRPSGGPVTIPGRVVDRVEFRLAMRCVGA